MLEQDKVTDITLAPQSWATHMPLASQDLLQAFLMAFRNGSPVAFLHLWLDSMAANCLYSKLVRCRNFSFEEKELTMSNHRARDLRQARKSYEEV